MWKNLGRKERAVEIDIGFKPEAAVPFPVLMQTEIRTLMSFGGWDARKNAPTVSEDGKPYELHGSTGWLHAVGTIEFRLCLVTKFGYPNDEALVGHPLGGAGLDPYAVHQVKNSTWIAALKAQNRVAFPADQSWVGDQKHFIITFHDSVFECLAMDLDLEISHKVGAEIDKELLLRLYEIDG